MSEEIRTTPGKLRSMIQRRLDLLQRRVTAARSMTARDAVPHVRLNAPKAFGDLRGSVHAVTDGAVPKLVVDAPHAAAVEKGSAPHNPNFEKLLAWVKLRGMQGLRNIRSAHLHGPSTRRQAQSVKALLREEVIKGKGGQYSPTDAPERVAMRIANQIRRWGTKPHWYVRDSLPVIAMRLGRNVRAKLKK